VLVPPLLVLASLSLLVLLVPLLLPPLVSLIIKVQYIDQHEISAVQLLTYLLAFSHPEPHPC
jgi:hypothetical protein